MRLFSLFLLFLVSGCSTALDRQDHYVDWVQCTYHRPVQDCD